MSEGSSPQGETTAPGVSPGPADPAGTDADVAAAGTEEALCALDGCDLPLPERPLDDQGRRRPGRSPRFCSKAHADQASRLRRARDTAAVQDPLEEARALGRSVVPAARELAGALAALLARFDQAEGAALGRVATAEREAAEAEKEALAAREVADRAERLRRQALAEVREAVAAREAAVGAAAAARREADQSRSQAWEQVAVHERARGQAEATRLAAQETVARLAVELREVREAVDAERGARGAVEQELAGTRRQLDLVAAERAAVAAQLGAAVVVRDELAVERDRARSELERLRGERDEASTRFGAVREELEAERERHRQTAALLATERAGHTLARERLRDAEEARAAAEGRAAELQSAVLRRYLEGRAPRDEAPEGSPEG